MSVEAAAYGLSGAVACCAPLGADVLSAEEAVATAELFRALSDPARVRVVNLLATSGDPVCVCTLVEPLGSETLLHVRLDSGEPVVCRLRSRPGEGDASPPPADARVGVWVAEERGHRFDAATGRRLE